MNGPVKFTMCQSHNVDSDCGLEILMHSAGLDGCYKTCEGLLLDIYLVLSALMGSVHPSQQP